MTVYFIPGLACDQALFKPLINHLHGFFSKNDIQYTVLEHMQPTHLHERISDYSKRLASTFQLENAVVIGVSLGGIIGNEVSKHTIIQKLITVSSVDHYRQIPISIRFLRFVPLYRLMPTKWSKWLIIHAAKWFNIIQPAYQKIWTEMVGRTSSAHLTWGRHQVIHWRGGAANCPTKRIIGDKDHIFSNISDSDIVIKSGTHAMVLNQSAIIAENIIELLKNTLQTH